MLISITIRGYAVCLDALFWCSKMPLLVLCEIEKMEQQRQRGTVKGTAYRLQVYTKKWQKWKRARIGLLSSNCTASGSGPVLVPGNAKFATKLMTAHVKHFRDPQNSPAEISTFDVFFESRRCSHDFATFHSFLF